MIPCGRVSVPQKIIKKKKNTGEGVASVALETHNTGDARIMKCPLRTSGGAREAELPKLFGAPEDHE